MDDVFLRFARAMIVIMLLYGAGMTLVILLGDHAIGVRMVSAFSSMFVAVLGFGSGYILGRIERKVNGKNGHNGKNGTNGINGKEAPHDNP